MNTAIMIGHISKEATTRTVKIKGADTLVTDFTVAVNEGYGDTRQTDFVVCSMWRDRGAKLAQYLTKGRSVVLKGRITARAWIATKGENAGKPMAQLVMSNPAVEFTSANPKADDEEEEIPFIPDETEA